MCGWRDRESGAAPHTSRPYLLALTFDRDYSGSDRTVSQFRDSTAANARSGLPMPFTE